MKLAHRRKYNGKARVAFERGRNDQRWMDAYVEEYFEPELPFMNGERIAPVRHGAGILAEVCCLDRSGAYPTLESALDMRDAVEVQHAVEARRCVVVRPRGATPAPAVDPAARAVDMLPKSVEPPMFSWVRFSLGCGLGAAAAAGAWLLIGWMLQA